MWEVFSPHFFLRGTHNQKEAIKEKMEQVMFTDNWWELMLNRQCNDLLVITQLLSAKKLFLLHLQNCKLKINFFFFWEGCVRLQQGSLPGEHHEKLCELHIQGKKLETLEGNLSEVTLLRRDWSKPRSLEPSFYYHNYILWA